MKINISTSLIIIVVTLSFNANTSANTVIMYELPPPLFYLHFFKNSNLKKSLFVLLLFYYLNIEFPHHSRIPYLKLNLTQIIYIIIDILIIQKIIKYL